MSQPRSILKKPAANAQAGPSRPKQGSKLKQTVAVAQPSRSQPAQRKKSGKSREDSDEEMASDEEEHSAGEDADEEDDEPDTDDEIARVHSKDTKKQPKRKVATTAETFGSTLTSLLSESAQPPSRPSKRSKPDEEPKGRKAPTQAPILALSRAPLPPSKNTLALERKAALALKHEKQEREDRARVKNVVEGWTHEGTGMGGMEFERQLRKTAQRGVIKLFNAILVASKNSETADLPLSVRAGVKHDRGKKNEKDNVLGRGGREELTKESFLDLVRKGGK